MALATATMAQQKGSGMSMLDVQCSSAVQDLAEIAWFARSSRLPIPHNNLLGLLVENGGETQFQ